MRWQMQKTPASAFTLPAILACWLLFGLQVAYAQTDPWYEALEQADARVAAFEDAVNSGNQSAIQRAALDLQADPIAVKRFNQNSTDAYRAAHNNVTDEIKDRTRKIMKEQMAKKLGIDPDNITTFEATNPPKPGDPIKVGQDWDITVRSNGIDKSHKVAGQFVNDAYYEAVTGSKPPSPEAANALAHRQAIEVTSYQHPEAYGGSQTEGGKIISDPKGNPTLRDPEQLGNTIEYKSNLPGNEARKLEDAGDFVRAQGFRMEQARQAAKQFDRQVAVRVAAMGGTVPPHVERAMNILRDMGDGKITPTQGKNLLAAMGETIDSAVTKSASLIESAQTLRPGGLGQADDVFVDNVRNRLRSKGIDPDSIRPLNPNADLTDLSKGVGKQAVRTWAGLALDTLQAVGWAADGYEISSAAAEYLMLLYKALDPNTPDDVAQALFDAMPQAALRVSFFGGMAALFEAYPPIAAAFGIFAITKFGLENTETGQYISAISVGLVDQEMLDDQSRAVDRASCDIKEFLGMENICAQLEATKRDLLLTYLRAIREGKLVLKEPFTAKDLGDSILAGVDASDMVERVDERERLLAANERYNALRDGVKNLEAQCGDVDLTRQSTRTYFEDTRALFNELSSNPAINTSSDATLNDTDFACEQLPKQAAGVLANANSVLRAGPPAKQAYDGSIAVLQRCESISAIDSARDLFNMGRTLVIETADQYTVMQINSSTFEVLTERLSTGNGRLDEISQTLNELDAKALTLKNRLGNLQGQLADVAAREQSCVSQAATLEAEVSALTPILGDQVAAERARVSSITQKASAKSPEYATDMIAGAEGVLQSVKQAQTHIATKRARYASCSAIELPVAEMFAATTAARQVPDIGQWENEAGALSLSCAEKHDPFAEDAVGSNEDDENGPGDDDGRGDYDFDTDQGNTDPDRSDPGSADLIAGAGGPAGLAERTENADGQPGAPIDPGYTYDPIEEERRERERARDAERIVAARGNARAGRGRGGIADEYSTPPDLNDIGNDTGNDTSRDDNNRRREEDRGRNDSSGTDANPTPENDEQPPVELPSPEPQPTPGPEDQVQEDDTEEPSEPDAPESETTPTPEPEPTPPPAPQPPPTNNNEQCRVLIGQLQQRTPRYTSLFGQFQAAVATKDEAKAHALGCEAITETDVMLGIFEEYHGAGCPIDGDISNLRNTLRTSRTAMQRGMKEECGVSAAQSNNFSGRWTSGGTCPGTSGDAGFRWVVTINQLKNDISGTVTFHRCPGGGRANYRVTGVAGSGDSVTLGGKLFDSRGPLAETASREITFEIKKNAPPSPNLAP